MNEAAGQLRASTASPPRPLIAVKDLLWLIYLYPVRLMASRLPVPLLHAFGRAIDPLYRLTVRTQMREALALMRQAFGATRTDAELNLLCRRFVGNAVRRTLDDLHLARPDAEARLRPPVITGLEHLQGAIAAGRGVLLIGGHFHANRVGKLHLRAMGFPVVSIRNHRPPDAWMGRLGEAFLQPRYIDFLGGVIREEVDSRDPECTLKILRTLRAGGLLHLLIDEYRATHTIKQPFLGGTRPFPTGFLELVRVSGCAVVPMLCTGSLAGCRIAFGEPLRLTPVPDRAAFAAANLPLFVRTLENQIREAPEEWDLWARL